VLKGGAVSTQVKMFDDVQGYTSCALLV